MGSYVYGFTSDAKMADFAGQRVKVYAYRCISKDTLFGSRRARARRRQANERYSLIQPQYAAEIFDKDWEGAAVYAGPTAGSFVDHSTLPNAGGRIGFLHKSGRRRILQKQRLLVSQTRHGEFTFPRHELQQIVSDKLLITVAYHVGGQWRNHEEMLAWVKQAQANAAA